MSDTKAYSVSDAMKNRIHRKIAWWKVRQAIKRTVRSRIFTFTLISALLIIVLALGLYCGWKIRDGAARTEIAAIEAERDAARKEMRFFQTTLRSLAEGARPETMATPRIREED